MTGITLMQMNRKGCSGISIKDCINNTYDGCSGLWLMEEDSVKLALHFIEVVKANSISRKRVKQDFVFTMMYRGGGTFEDDFFVKNEFAQQFFQLYKILSLATKNAHQHGLDEGKSILIGLNNGSISMNDFLKEAGAPRQPEG